MKNLFMPELKVSTTGSDKYPETDRNIGKFCELLEFSFIERVVHIFICDGDGESKAWVNFTREDLRSLAETILAILGKE